MEMGMQWILERKMNGNENAMNTRKHALHSFIIMLYFMRDYILNISVCICFWMRYGIFVYRYKVAYDVYEWFPLLDIIICFVSPEVVECIYMCVAELYDVQLWYDLNGLACVWFQVWDWDVHIYS
jgi:hypothetical protein